MTTEKQIEEINFLKSLKFNTDNSYEDYKRLIVKVIAYTVILI